jgi:hypothetical protein
MKYTLVLVMVICLTSWFTTGTVQAHCDTLDGPVVLTAKAALEKGDITPVLKWVKAENEVEIRAAFKKTLAVRGKGAEARELADQYFFETLVRLHRAGEGAPFDGLKPAGTVEPVVAEADQALAAGKVDDLVGDVSKAVGDGIRQRFNKAMAAKKHADENVEAGREYVEAYVSYIHYVEGMYEAAKSAAHGHVSEAETHAGHHD